MNMTTTAIDYGGRRFRPVRAGGDGQPDGDGIPTGRYHQDGNLVWAEFAGGTVRGGRLVGTCRQDGTIDAAYCLVGKDGRTAAGAVVSTPTVLDDGRLRLTEHWRRLDGTSGESIIEEITE